MARRGYSNVANIISPTGALNNTDTSTVIAVTPAPVGWPAAPFFAVISQGQADEELIYVITVAGSNLTAVRGSSLAAPFGSTTKAHIVQPSTTIKHVASASDFDEANAHINDPTLNDHTQYAQDAMFWMRVGA